MIYEFLDGILIKSDIKDWEENKEFEEEEVEDTLKRIGFKEVNTELIFDDTFGITTYIDKYIDNDIYALIQLELQNSFHLIIVKSFEDYMSFLAKYAPMIESLINIYRASIKAKNIKYMKDLGL